MKIRFDLLHKLSEDDVICLFGQNKVNVTKFRYHYNQPLRLPRLTPINYNKRK